jgi:hypothetical protein
MKSRVLAANIAAALALSLMGSAANAIPINVAFNFVPTGALTANTGDVTNAATITSGAPDIVTTIIQNNVNLVTGQTIDLTSPTPLTLGSTFTKSFTTALGIFTEALTVSLVTPGPSSLGITATGTITETTVLSGALLTPSQVFYSAAYTQNGGPGAQINASFNDSTTPPSPIPLPGALALFAGGLGLMGLLGRRRKQRASNLPLSSVPAV